MRKQSFAVPLQLQVSQDHHSLPFGLEDQEDQVFQVALGPQDAQGTHFVQGDQWGQLQKVLILVQLASLVLGAQGAQAAQEDQVDQDDSINAAMIQNHPPYP